MDIKPVKKYETPKYPDRKTAINNPEMLRQLPDRWKRNIYVTTALSSLIVFMLASCRESKVVESNIEVKEAKVAPIFDYGNGRGSFGCMSIAPPSFLSEDEAFQVIQEEGKRYDINFNKNGLELKNVNIPETKYFLKNEDEKEIDNNIRQKAGVINSSKTGDLKLDGYDSEKKIGFEFISKEDYDNWHVEQEMHSSVEDFDFLSTSKILRDELQNKNGDTSIGVFYNSMEVPSREDINKAMEKGDWEGLEAKVKDMAENNLRKQVMDFFEWLKSQGII